MTSAEAATVVVFFELVLGLLLHGVGISLLLAAQSSTISSLMFIELSFIEICYMMHEGISNIYLIKQNGYIGLQDKWGLTIIVFLHSIRFMTLMAITIDRVLSVKLGLTYGTTVTKFRLAIVVTCIWLLSACLALLMWFCQKRLFSALLLTLESLLAAVYICSYIFIILALKQRQKKFPNQSTRRTLNVKVPFLLVLAVICCSWIPELILAAGVEFSIWFLSLFYLSNIIDALLYIFALPQCRRRLRKFCCNAKIRPCQNRVAINSISHVVVAVPLGRSMINDAVRN